MYTGLPWIGLDWIALHCIALHCIEYDPGLSTNLYSVPDCMQSNPIKSNPIIAVLSSLKNYGEVLENLIFETTLLVAIARARLT
jgi:hypothetical protein